MNREMLSEHLNLAERHVAEGERVLKHQRCVIDHLRRHHRSEMLGAAERLLRSFEEVQSLHAADVNRLRDELEELGPAG